MRDTYNEIRRELAGLNDEQARGVLELTLQQMSFQGVNPNQIVRTVREQRFLRQPILDRMARETARRWQ